MSASLFHKLGPYEIERQIGRGGMATVFLARDTRLDGRVVALKVIAAGPDADARDIAEAEQRGAELQRQFLATSPYVPELYEIGQTPDFLYIAMEYLDGEDLSSAIRRGALEPDRAVRIAIQLCRFLEEIDHLDLGTAGASPLTLLHNDLKPTNIRLVADDRVKVLDFGAAKALSLTRRVTRNDFFSTPYLSPECLDTGERDRQTDAWALGVILYEMLAGAPPFRASDTRRLEARILSRRPAEPPAAAPTGLQAIVAKLLAPRPEDRYTSAAAIRCDLDAFLARTETLAEREGWPARAMDEMPTRPVDVSTEAMDDEPPTRRTAGAAMDEAATRPLRSRTTDDSASAASASAAAAPAAASQTDDASAAARSVGPAALPAKPVARSGRRHRYWRIAVVTLLLAVCVNEACVWNQSRRVSQTVPAYDLTAVDDMWSQYQSLRRRSVLGIGARGLAQALQRHSLALAERVTANYRTPSPTVREAQWQATAHALERVLDVAPGDPVARGTLRYAQGHLHRINGEASQGRGQTTVAQQHFADAIAAFREAAELRPEWPDPFLGLARTFIYGLEDIDRGADAMAQAERLGYVLGSRETAQLADGYRARGDALERAAGELVGMPQEREFLSGARDAYRKALELYTEIANFGDAPAQIRLTQRRLDEVERKLGALEDGSTPGRILRGIGRILREF